MEKITSTGPIDMIPGGYEVVEKHLIESIVAVLGSPLGQQSFFENGLLYTLDPSTPIGEPVKYTPMWIKMLTAKDLDPGRVMAKTTRNGKLLAVRIADDSIMGVAYPNEVRFVNSVHSGRARVMPSGLILKENYTLVTGETISREELEEIIIISRRGIIPPWFCEIPIVRTDPEAAEPGQEVDLFFFKNHVSLLPTDVVAVTQNRMLLPRELSYPLSSCRYE